MTEHDSTAALVDSPSYDPADTDRAAEGDAVTMPYLRAQKKDARPASHDDDIPL